MIRLIMLALVLAVGFYVGWPAYSGYEIRTALEAKDATLLGRKIDFASVKESLRPAATAQAEKVLAEALQKAGPAAGSLNEQTKAQILPKLVDATLAAVVTPENLIRFYAAGASKEALAGIVTEQMGTVGIPGLDKIGGLTGGSPGGLGNLSELGKSIGLDTGKLGGLFGKKETASPPPQTTGSTQTGEQPSYGLANVKQFGPTGPLGIALGVAKDPAATEPDVTVEMSFIDNDWKLTAIRPRI
jgi:hypothetical protein